MYEYKDFVKTLYLNTDYHYAVIFRDESTIWCVDQHYDIELDALVHIALRHDYKNFEWICLDNFEKKILVHTDFFKS